MISETMRQKVEQSRRDGYIVLSTEDGPVRLDVIVEFAQSVFPNLRLDQLAVIQAEDDQFVIAAALDTNTKSN